MSKSLALKSLQVELFDLEQRMRTLVASLLDSAIGATADQFAPGDYVWHDSFRYGKVESTYGENMAQQVEVRFFPPHGRKRLLVRYAPMRPAQASEVRR